MSIEALQAKQAAELMEATAREQIAEDFSAVMARQGATMLFAADLPPGAHQPLMQTLIYGSQEDCENIVARPSRVGQEITCPGYDANTPSRYTVEVVRNDGFTLDLRQPGEDNEHSLQAWRDDTWTLHGMNNEFEALDRGEEPVNPDGPFRGFNTATGRWEFRLPVPRTAEEWRPYVERQLPKACGPRAHPEQVREIIDHFRKHADNPNELSTLALVRQMVPGPEGGMVTSYDLHRWSPAEPYPGAVADRYTVRKLVEIARDQAEIDLRYGRDMGMLHVRSAFASDEMTAEFRQRGDW